jgi:REP element-mobilizing transposase RayT
MRNFKRFDVPNTPYFVTTATLDRRPLFASPRLAQIVVDNIDFYERRGDYELLAFVVMPDHVHLLLTPQRGSISDVLRNLKSFIAKQVQDARRENGPIWQQSFHDRVVRCEDDVHRFAEYIHYNPVEAGLVAEPEDFVFSSARLGLRTSAGQGWGPDPRWR